MSLKFLALFAAVAAQLAAAQAPSASPSSAPCNAKADLSANRAAYSAPNDIFQNYPAPSIAPVPANVNQSCTSIYSYSNFEAVSREAFASNVLLIPNVCESSTQLGNSPYLFVDSMISSGIWRNETVNKRSLMFILPYLRPGRHSLALGIQTASGLVSSPLNGNLEVSVRPPNIDNVAVQVAGVSRIYLTSKFSGGVFGYTLSPKNPTSVTVFATLKRVNNTCSTSSASHRDCTAGVFSVPLPNGRMAPGSSFRTDFYEVLGNLTAYLANLGYTGGVDAGTDAIYVNAIPDQFSASVTKIGNATMFVPQLMGYGSYDTTLSAISRPDYVPQSQDEVALCPWLIEYRARGLWNNFYTEVPDYGEFCCSYGTSELVCKSDYRNKNITGINGLDERCRAYSGCLAAAGKSSCNQTLCQRDMLVDLRVAVQQYCRTMNSYTKTAYTDATCTQYAAKLADYLSAQVWVSVAGGMCPTRPPLPTSSKRLTANVWGDPHYNTFDGVSYTQMGPGDRRDYVLFVGFNGTVNQVTVHSRPVRWPNTLTSTATMNAAYGIQAGVNGDVVELYNLMQFKDPLAIFVNQVRIVLRPGQSYSFVGGVIYRKDSPNVLFLDTDSGFSLIFTAYGASPWVYDFRVYLPADFASRSGAILGLLGTPDGNRTNEFTMLNGTVTRDARVFHESWTVSRNYSLIALEDVITKRVSTRSLIAEWDRVELAERADDSSSGAANELISGSNHTLAAALDNLRWTNATYKAAVAKTCGELPADMGFGCAYDLFVASEFTPADAAILNDATHLAVVLGEYSSKDVKDVKVQASGDKALVSWQFSDAEAVAVQISIQETPGFGGWKTFRADRPSTSFVIQGLKANATYEVRIAPIYQDDGSLSSGQVGNLNRRSSSNIQIIGSYAGLPFSTSDASDVGSGGDKTGPNGDGGKPTGSDGDKTAIIAGASAGGVAFIAVVAAVAVVLVRRNKSAGKGSVATADVEGAKKLTW